LIGIYGGTFDPIHYGHVRMAVFVQQRLRLQRLHMIPCAQPVHRQAPQASAEQRFEMLRVALMPFPALIPDRIEIDRPGPSYTFDTVAAFHRQLGQRVCLVIGYDAFCGFSSWHQWQRIPDHAHIIVLRREQDAMISPADFPAPLQQLVADLSRDERQLLRLDHQADAALVFLSNPKFSESSSAIRQAIRDGASVRHRIPLAVADFIEKSGLYRGAEPAR